MRNILISAYACEPFKGSEQGVGWNWILQMAKNNFLHVITRENNKELIEANLPLSISNNIKFYFYDTNSFFKGFKNKAKGLYFYYFFWQLGIIPLIKKIIEKQNIDYTLHLTMGSIWMPTFLPIFKTPFIWGPVGGGEGVPKNFLRTLPFKNRIIQSLRYFLKGLSKINPLITFTSKRAVAIITRTHNTAQFIPERYVSKTKVFLETSMEASIFEYKKVHQIQNGKINLILSGRLVPFKNVISVIKALQYIPNSIDFKLTIIGSGSEKNNLEKEIFNLNLSDKICFVEEITREEVLNKLSQSDIYLFPSLREAGSWALMEAMAIGLPVICLKWSGMEIITDEASAIRLPVTSPHQMPIDLASAICKLIDNPSLRNEMGLAARERIKNVFNWEAKGVFVENLFKELEYNKSILK